MKAFATLVSLLLASPAAAFADGEPTEDPEALIRLARVADQVEGDAAKARALFARVWAIAPQTPTGLSAGLRLSELTEERDQRLALLKDLTARHSARLTAGQKQQIHDAIRKSLAPGEQAMTPLGMLHVSTSDADAQVGGSPVETKLRTIFRVHRVEQLPRAPHQQAKRRDLARELKALGEPGQQALRRFVQHGHPDEALRSAILLQPDDPAAALQGYARAIRTGRAVFRQSVLGALRTVPVGKDTSPHVLRALRPLLALDHVQDVHRSLIDILASHMSDDELLPHLGMRAPHAQLWMRQALARPIPGAYTRLTKQLLGPTPPPWGIRELGRGLARLSPGSMDPKRVSKETWRSIFDLLARPGEANLRSNWSWLARALKVHGALAGVREAHWRAALLAEDKATRTRLAVIAQRAGIKHVPSSAIQSEQDWDRLVSLLVQVPCAASWMKESEPLWRATLRALQAASSKHERISIGNTMGPILGTKPPGDAAGAALAFLKTADASTYIHQWIWRAAGEGGDAAFLDHVRSHLARLHKNSFVRAGLDAFLRTGTGKDIVPFATHVLQAKQDGLKSWAVKALWSHRADPRAAAALVRASTDAGAIPALVSRLSPQDAQQEELLHKIYTWATTASLGDTEGVRRTLTLRAQTLRLRAAVPFLLKEYERAPAGPARDQLAAALDSIRAHHERLDFFRTWQHDDESEKQVVSMLDDDDPAIRRAAVMSLATLQGARALPRLLQIAKADADDAVRAAALASIERVATAAQSNRSIR